MVDKKTYYPDRDKRWNEKNKEHRNYLSARGTARGFIRNKATIDDLLELRQLIDERMTELEKPTK